MFYFIVFLYRHWRHISLLFSDKDELAELTHLYSSIVFIVQEISEEIKNTYSEPCRMTFSSPTISDIYESVLPVGGWVVLHWPNCTNLIYVGNHKGGVLLAQMSLLHFSDGKEKEKIGGVVYV